MSMFRRSRQCDVRLPGGKVRPLLAEAGVLERGDRGAGGCRDAERAGYLLPRVMTGADCRRAGSPKPWRTCSRWCND